MKELLPVVVFAYNRPHKLRRILAALRPQNIDRLLVFVDGPLAPEDRAMVEACRQLAFSVDWVEKELHFSELNSGSRNLHLNIGKVFEQYPASIFLEDDCLPMPGFYDFMRQALDHYGSKRQVFSIGGYQPVAPAYFKGSPYVVVSSARFLGWGWATWCDRWQEIEPYLERFTELFDGLADVPELVGLDVQLVIRAIKAGQLVSDWDYRVLIASLWLKKVHMLPVRGLIRNIGLDRSGVHGSFRGILRDWFVHNWNVVNRIPSNRIWLEDIRVDEKYAARLQQFFYQSRSLSLRLVMARTWDILTNL